MDAPPAAAAEPPDCGHRNPQVKTMKIASIQMSVCENDKAATISKAVAKIRQCRGVDLILLPEIWNIGFMSFDRYIEEAETPIGPTLSAIRTAAREVGAHIHAGSLVEKDGSRYFNSSYLISPQGEILANYRKIHLFGYQSEEARILSAGNSICVVPTPLATFGLAACFDLRFPELFRRLVDAGAEVLLVCSAWPYPRLEPWLLFTQVRAVENQCFLAACNAAGQNRGVQFVGHSRIVDPWGTVLAGAGDPEAIVRIEIDPSVLKGVRKSFPALSSRVGWLENR